MEAIIDIRSISFSYPQSKRLVLNDCSLQIMAGEITSFLGPNGAGKSTLLNCACGLLRPQSGDIYLNEKSIWTMKQTEIAKVVGYVQQYQNSSFAHSVFDYVLMGRASNISLFQKPSEADRELVYEVLEKMGITYLADCAITEISGGERQQAAIARAIVQHPQVIFFDEPTSHLDYGNQISILQIIHQLKEQGYAVVMTTHNPDHCLMLGGNVAVLDRKGHLCYGQVSEIITEERLRSIYNTDITIRFFAEAGRPICIPTKKITQ